MRLRLLACFIVFCAVNAAAQHGNQGREKAFTALMHEAMSKMDRGMMDGPSSGHPDRDFVRMMIPHHRGAIDMSRALLLYGRDRELQQLAKSIVTEQQNEIQLMQLWLARHPPQKAAGKDRE